MLKGVLCGALCLHASILHLRQSEQTCCVASLQQVQQVALSALSPPLRTFYIPFPSTPILQLWLSMAENI
jgi:hypothetical protein